MMRGSGVLTAAAVAAAVVVCAAVPATATAGAGDALDKPAFTATAKELLAAAGAAPAGDWPVVVLREDVHATFDADGKEVRRWRMVFVVRSQAGVDTWGTLVGGYRPFYQDRPVVRARVIAPGGTIAELDPTLVTDAPRYEESATVFSDARNIEAPLPRLAVGAVVEEEIVITDRIAMLAAGTTDGVGFGNAVPTASTVITVSAPIALHLKRSERGIPVAAKRTATKDRETWTYRVGALDPLPEPEAWVDGDSYTGYLGLATGASWGAVAKGYAELVEAKLTAGPATLPASIKAAATRATVDALVQWLHEHIRYTGIELADAAIIPATPAQTVQRGFGDCKDKAALLVSLLRQAGIDADLAVLSTGPGVDVDPALPGLGMFDHAIVRARLGGRDLWIDATEDLVAVGRLPSRDQGRRALVVDAATKALVTTPVDAPADNLIREVRTFALAETGAGAVTEVSREGGVFEPELRAWIRDSRADDVKKGLGAYVTAEYGGTVDRYQATAAGDLAVPFTVTTTVARAAQAMTDRDEIRVDLRPYDVLAKVPPLVIDAPDPADPAPPRKADFVWFRPHVYEIEHRLELPPGYTPPALPADRTVKLGTATFTERDKLDGRTVVVTYRFDSGKRRLKPAELAALQTAVRELTAETRRITIEHTASALTEQGKHAEAIAEIKRLIALHPKEAVHHSELAHALMAVGLGEAARREARRAVALEPKNADAHVVLGWALRQDTVGREHGFDFDRKGAIEALRKARTLDPKHVGAAVELASVLQVGPSGRLLDPGSDPRAAAVEWRAAYDLDGTDTNASRLLAVLLGAGDGAACEQFARSRPASLERDAYLVGAIAIRDGTAKAVTAGDALRTGTERRQMFEAARANAALLGRYDDARAFQARAIPNPTYDAVFARLARITKLAPAGKDPVAAARAVMLGLLDAGWPAAPYLDDHVGEAVAYEYAGGVNAVLAYMPALYVRDFITAAADTTAEGGKTGPWRVTVKAVGGTQQSILYVGLVKGAARVLGTPTDMRGVGRYAQRLVADGELDAARALFDWVAADRPGSRLTAVWGPKLPRDADAAAVAAAVMAASTGSPGGVKALLGCKTTAPGARDECDFHLAGLYVHTARWDDALAHATAWDKRIGPGAVAPTRLQAWALAELGRTDEADRVLTSGLKQHPDNVDLLKVRVRVAWKRGAADEIARRTDAVVAAAGGDLDELHEAAWAKLVIGADLATAEQWAEQVLAARPGDQPTLNTVAAIEAERGDVGAAKTHQWETLEKFPRRPPASEQYYVVGRIAEQLGLRDDAIAAYRKVTVDADAPPEQSPYTLAGKRLAGLGAKR
jgi:tetratricopeptide (TPR) repeat protein/transglutaminase-like putative cysteine protease